MRVLVKSLLGNSEEASNARFGDDTRQMFVGPAYTTLNLSFSGGLLNISDKSDILDPSKVTEYAKQIDKEVKKDCFEKIT